MDDPTTTDRATADGCTNVCMCTDCLAQHDLISRLADETNRHNESIKLSARLSVELGELRAENEKHKTLLCREAAEVLRLQEEGLRKSNETTDHLQRLNQQAMLLEALQSQLADLEEDFGNIASEYKRMLRQNKALKRALKEVL